jgi:hypothetical protein
MPTSLNPSYFASVANEFVTYSPAKSSLTLLAVRASQRPIHFAKIFHLSPPRTFAFSKSQ